MYDIQRDRARRNPLRLIGTTLAGEKKEKKKRGERKKEEGNAHGVKRKISEQCNKL